MKVHLCMSLSVIPFLGSGAAAAAGPSHAASRNAIVPIEDARNLKGHSISDLVSLRAGGVDGPVSIGAAERAALCTAQARNGGLEQLRGGVVGETTVLLLILVVLIVVLL
jgi:hypothetical protein